MVSGPCNSGIGECYFKPTVPWLKKGRKRLRDENRAERWSTLVCLLSPDSTDGLSYNIQH